QATGNRQQATGNRQQATGNRQQATGNRQQATGNRQQATGYLNVLRVYACIAVIVFHVFSNDSSLTEFEKYICVILNNIWLWHVPSFVMISGVLFLDKEKEISVSKIYKKYVFRIVLALVIFGLPFAFMELFFNAHYQFNIEQIGTAIINVFQGKLWDHMWYLYMIIGLYILLPLFKIFVNFAGKKALEYVIIILFIFTSVIPTLQNIFPYKLGSYIPINSVFVLYLLLGHYIHQYDVRINNKLLFLTSLLYLLYMALISLNKNFINGTNIIGLNGNISPLVVMITLCVFCFIRQNISSNKIYDFVSQQVFGMYLIHPLFLNMFFKFIKFTPEKYPLILVVICITVTTVIFSFLFSIIARKIKIIKKYVL
ncbi:MAG: acyltransferase family protein, partial [Treponema sp.]|nr:acyltransferase family protein [Treponema sp.]